MGLDWHSRWAIVATLAALLPSAVRADALEDFQHTQAFQKAQMQRRIDNLRPMDPDHPSRPATDVMSLEIFHQNLVVRTALASTPQGKLVKVRLGSSKNWAMCSIGNGAQGDGAVIPANFTLAIYDFEPEQTRVFSVRQEANSTFFFLVQTQSVHRIQTIELSEQLSPDQPQNLNTCQLGITSNGTPPPAERMLFNSKTFFDMVREHPVEVDRYLQPAFRQLGQESALAPDPLLALEVFSDLWKPDPAAVAKVNALLPGLTGGDFRTRNKAEKDLSALGSDVALILLHLDPTKLDPEQNARVDKVLAPYALESIKDAECLRSDPVFLLTCLYSQDPIVRKTAFAGLQAIAKQPLTFDPAADADVRAAAISALLQKLIAAKVIVPKL